MDKVTKTQKGDDFSFKKFFVPMNTVKVVHWIVIIGFVVYANMLFNGFIQDDNTYIINNSALQIASSFRDGNNFNGFGQYRPIPALYFAAIYAMFTKTPFFYHFLQILIHISCAIVVFLIFRKFLTINIAFLLTLVFLVHPINVESVSYIAQSGNPLFFLFGGVSLVLAMQEKLTVKKYFIIFFLLLMSILTKETGILFLFLILLYRLLFQPKKLIKFMIGGIVVVIVYFLIRFLIGNVGFSIRPLVPIADLPINERIISIPAIVLFYLKTFFFPINLAIDQFWTVTSLNFSSFYFPLLVDVVFLFLLLLLGKYFYIKNKQSFRIYIFFLLWFLAGLGFHLQIFPLDKTVADRWFYFPLVGLLGMIALFLQQISIDQKKIRSFLLTFLIIVIGMLSFRTIVRNTNWVDAITLYSHDIQYNDNFELENQLGGAYSNKLEFARAIPYFKRSIAMRPYEYNLLNLAVAYTATGNMQEAKKYFEAIYYAKKYILFTPHEHSNSFYRFYAAVLIFYDKSPAISVIQSGLKDYPDDSALWLYLALSYDMLHDKSNAINAAKKAYQIYPSQMNKNVFNSLKNNVPFSLYYDGFAGDTITFKSN